MPEYDLYDGDITLNFDPDDHIYYVNDKPVPSTTTITGMIAKPALVSWAAKMAAEHIKKALVPGKSLDEVDIDELANAARWAYRRSSGRALSVGSVVHEYIESLLKYRLNGTPKPSRPVNAQAQAAVDAWFEWFREHEVEPQAVERIIYSREHEYAGTLDLQATVEGELAVVDWKTSKAIYPDYYLQGSAYALALEEETGEKVQQVWVVRVAKDGAGWEAGMIERDEMLELQEVFLAAYKIWQWKN